MSFDQFRFDSCQWISTKGYLSDLVISSRIRLARNIDRIPFSHWATGDQLEKVVGIVRQAIKASPLLSDLELFSLDDATSLDRQFLWERHLISKELAEGEKHRLVAIDKGERTSIMVNEEDHLRLQCLKPGLDLMGAWQTVNRVDDELEQSIDYAFSPKWGYLTACPTNAGTGIRASIMMHLPGLVMAKQVDKVLHAVTQLGLTVRGMFGEGTEAKGNLFQFSNQITLGISELDTIDKLEKVATQIIKNEKDAESEIYKEARATVEDRVWRAYSVLANARIISTEETVELLSAVRMGVNMGIINNLTNEEVNEILICTRPAHLQKRAGDTLNSRERDILRADFIRERLAAKN